jgi:hypothetical protein
VDIHCFPAGGRLMSNSPVQIVKSNTMTTAIAKTGEGNSLIVCINSYNLSTPSISYVKLGSTSLALAESKVISSSGATATYIYYLSDIDADETSVIISGSVNVANGSGGVVIYEVPGLLTVSALDKINNGGGSGSSWTSNATGALGQDDEFVVGTAIAPYGTAMSNPAGWTPATDIYGTYVAGCKVVSDGSTQTFNGTQNETGAWSACIASFKISAGSASAETEFFM